MDIHGFRFDTQRGDKCIQDTWHIFDPLVEVYRVSSRLWLEHLFEGYWRICSLHHPVEGFRAFMKRGGGVIRPDKALEGSSEFGGQISAFEYIFVHKGSKGAIRSVFAPDILGLLIII